MRLATAAALLLIMALLAGCAGKGGGGDSDGDSSGSTSGTGTGSASGSSTRAASGSGTRSGSASATGTDQPNRAPTATLVADPLSGSAPLRVNLTLGGADADGDALSWNLSADGTELANGTTLPATANATLAAGNHTFVLTVSDGKLAGNASVTVAVAPGVQDWQVHTGAIEGESAACVGAGYDATSSGFVAIDVLPLSIGKPYTVDFRSGAVADVIVFVDAAGEELARVLVGFHEMDWSASGTVPAGAAKVAFAACGNTFTETFNYVAGTPPEGALPAPL